MNKKGFTLIELLGVVIIVAILSLVLFPNIMNLFKKNKENVSNATKRMIEEAADLYIYDHLNDYPKVNGEYYCISLTELIADERLTEPLIDPSTGKEIPDTYSVKAIVQNSQYNYEIITDGSCIK